jgi:hypothetical protein
MDLSATTVRGTFFFIIPAVTYVSKPPKIGATNIVEPAGIGFDAAGE